MSSETQTTPSATKARMGALISLCVVAGVLWAANWFLLSKFIADPAARGQFGDMFGAVNALFTALAFAGLIYTVLLQRDQLALQQQEIVESGKTQEQLVQRQIDAQNTLFERQKAFQEEQRQKQIAHDLKLEELRQKFEEIIEGRRKDREIEAREEFARNVLCAIRRELEALGQIYDAGIGALLKPLVDGQVFGTQLALTQDWFTVFTANAVHLGKVPGEISVRIISIYAMLKGLIEEFRINNRYLEAMVHLEFELKERQHEAALRDRYNAMKQLLLSQAIKIRKMDLQLKTAVTELYSMLDQRGIK